MRLVSFLLTLLCSFSVAAIELPQESRVPGGIALVPLTGLHSEAAPSAWYRGNRVMVLPSQDTPYAQQAPWLAVIGIPLSAKPADTQLMKADGQRFPFKIQDKEYKEQRLTVSI